MLLQFLCMSNLSLEEHGDLWSHLYLINSMMMLTSLNLEAQRIYCCSSWQKKAFHAGWSIHPKLRRFGRQGNYLRIPEERILMMMLTVYNLWSPLAEEKSKMSFNAQQVPCGNIATIHSLNHFLCIYRIGKQQFCIDLYIFNSNMGL